MKWFAWGDEISSFREKSGLALCWECVCVCVIFPSPCLPDSFSSDMNNEVFGREPLGVDPAGSPSSPHLATSPRCYCTHPESLFLSGEWKGGRTWLRVTSVPVSFKPIVITSWCLSTPPPPPLSLLYRPRVFSSLSQLCQTCGPLWLGLLNQALQAGLLCFRSGMIFLFFFLSYFLFSLVCG